MRYASGLVAIIVLLVILVWALLRANAAWHFFAAQAIAEPLFDTGKVTVTVFEESESHLDIALRRFPNNPDYLDFAGRLMLLQANQIGVMGLERRELLESAADNFRRALSVRPLWPYSWANLLATKDKQGQVDMEFNKALKTSAELGPWEPRVQLRVIQSGLRHWSELGAAEQRLVQGKIDDALKRQPRAVFGLVQRYGMPELICHARETHAQIGRWCEKVL